MKSGLQGSLLLKAGARHPASGAPSALCNMQLQCRIGITAVAGVKRAADEVGGIRRQRSGRHLQTT